MPTINVSQFSIVKSNSPARLRLALGESREIESVNMVVVQHRHLERMWRAVAVAKDAALHLVRSRPERLHLNGAQAPASAQ